MADMKINASVRHNGVLYAAGSDAKLLNERISPKTAKRLNELRIDDGEEQERFHTNGLTGNKEVKDEVQKPRLLSSPDAGQPARPQGIKRESTKKGDVEPERTPAPPGGGGTELPVGFPHRQDLITAGFDTTEKVKAASDQQLIDADGIGDAGVKKIRKELK